MFFVVREGSYEVVKIFLDYFVNRDIIDYMDRFFRDVVRDRMYYDIVRFLDEYNVILSFLGIVLIFVFLFVICGFNRFFFSLKYILMGKKFRRFNVKSVMFISFFNFVKEIKDVKGSRRKKFLSDKG